MPSGSIAGRSLTAVVAIMTFLAVITTGAVMIVVKSANDWQSDVGREVTIQVRPIANRNIENDVRTAVGIARGTAGIADVRAYTKEESQQLVEPWLGSGLALGELPDGFFKHVAFAQTRARLQLGNVGHSGVRDADHHRS